MAGKQYTHQAIVITYLTMKLTLFLLKSITPLIVFAAFVSGERACAEALKWEADRKTGEALEDNHARRQGREQRRRQFCAQVESERRER